MMFLSSRIFTAKEVTDGHAIIRNSFSEDDYDSLARSFFFLPLKWQIEITKNKLEETIFLESFHMGKIKSNLVFIF